MKEDKVIGHTSTRDSAPRGAGTSSACALSCSLQTEQSKKHQHPSSIIKSRVSCAQRSLCARSAEATLIVSTASLSQQAADASNQPQESRASLACPSSAFLRSVLLPWRWWREQCGRTHAHTHTRRERKTSRYTHTQASEQESAKGRQAACLSNKAVHDIHTSEIAQSGVPR